MRQVSCFDEDISARISGGCVALLSVRCCFEGGVGTWLQGQDRVVFGCALMRLCRECQSPVWIASAAGHISCVEALILAKADVLQCDK
jgi:hypothetical protein